MQLGDRMLGHNRADQRMSGNVVYSDGDRLTYQAFGSVEYDNSIAMGPARHLNRRARSGGLEISLFAWTFNQNLNIFAQETLVVFFANPILDCQEIVVAPAFDFEWDIVGQVV